VFEVNEHPLDDRELLVRQLCRFSVIAGSQLQGFSLQLDQFLHLGFERVKQRLLDLDAGFECSHPFGFPILRGHCASSSLTSYSPQMQSL
jgi:hypothetical protein